MKKVALLSLFRSIVLTALGFGAALSPVRAQFAVLHSFTGTNGDGAMPSGALTLSGTSLYGSTYWGGVTNYGIIFQIGINGAGYVVRHGFRTGDGDGPTGSLQLRGTILYGMTTTGDGSLDGGVVFRINTDGSSYTKLYSFFTGEGYYPHGSLTLDTTTLMLYGMTSSGGAANWGMVFRMSTSGSGNTNLHSFAGGTSDGRDPGENSLTLSGNGTTLYGMTPGGGVSDLGVVFKINTDGSGYTNLHSFTGGSGGANPQTGLVLWGNTLYGTTSSGGSFHYGTVFAVNTNGTGFTNLHNFSGVNDGAYPYAGLIMSGNTLYGTASGGGSSGNGTVFAINADGTGFTTLHSFTGGTNGADPRAGLTLSGNTLYGTTSSGGSSGVGTLFSLSLPQPPPQLTINCSAANVILTWPTNAAGFTLQSTTNLASQAVWSANSPAPTIVNGQNAVTNPISGTQKYYRLSQ